VNLTTKIGIIRCQARSEQCSANHCLRASYKKTGEFAKYDSYEILGIDTCGGCWHGSAKKVLEKAKILKERGEVDVIHLSTCIMLWCPWKKMFENELKDKIGLPIHLWTHELPEGYQRSDDW
jgi:predicted metal-binding protein